MLSDTPEIEMTLGASEYDSASDSRVSEGGYDGGSSKENSEPGTRDSPFMTPATGIKSEALASDLALREDNSITALDEFLCAVFEVPDRPKHDPTPSEFCCSPHQHFADTQVGDANDLKRVVFLPDLHLLLAGLASEQDRPTKEQADSGGSHAKQAYYTLSSLVRKEGNDVNAIGEMYKEVLGQPCLKHARGFLPRLLPLRHEIKPSYKRNPLNGWMTCGVPTSADDDDREILDYSAQQDLSLDEHTLLHDVATHCPMLLQWQIFCRNDDSNSIIQSLKGYTHFPWASLRFCDRDPHLQPNTTRKPDAPNAPWTTTWISDAMSTLEDPNKPPPEPWYNFPADSTYSHDPRHYLQRMWTQSVVWDTTFMVFHNGEWERIGVRNRATQTLFLSDLIFFGASDYTKIQLGLHIAAIRDALCRLPLLSHSPLHHPGPSLPHPPSYVPSSRGIVVSDPRKYSDYNDLLFRVHAGGSYSRHPLVLHRLCSSPGGGADQYPTEPYGSHQRLTLTIGVELGRETWSTCIARRAVLSCPDFSCVEVVVLLSFDHISREVQRADAEILGQLAPRNGPSAPKFYGIFADTHSWMTILILEYVGQTIPGPLVETSSNSEDWEPSQRSIPSNDLRHLKEAVRALYGAVTDTD